MPGLSQGILERASTLPEGAPLCPSALLHLGSRAAVDQALSRLARRGRLMRICQGVYMSPVETRFGPRAPAIEKAIASLSAVWGETIVPCGASAANTLGLSTQMPVRPGLSDIGSQAPTAIRCTNRALAPRAALATGSASSSGGRCHPRVVLARSPGDR